MPVCPGRWVCHGPGLYNEAGSAYRKIRADTVRHDGNTLHGRRRGRRNARNVRGTVNTSGASAPSVGAVVAFTGNLHYTSANAANGKPCKPGAAKVTQIVKGAKHPYQLIREIGGGSTVCGWVDAADIATGAEADIRPKWKKAAAIHFLPAKEGIIRRISVDGEIWKLKGMEDVVIDKKEGDEVHGTKIQQ